MKTFNDNFGPWASFPEGETIDGGLGSWDSDDFIDNYETTGWPVDDSTSHVTATLQIPDINDPNFQFPGQLLGFLEGPIDHSMDMAAPEFSLGTEITSPSSSGGVILTPTSVDFGSISSPTMSDLGLSPFTLIGQSPLGWEPLQSPFINSMPQPAASRPNMHTYIEGTAFSEAAPTAAQGVEVYQPSPPRAKSRRQPRRKDCPPEMHAREFRNRFKPERCPECPMRFNYVGERDKHIAARHPDVAGKHGVPLEIHTCQHCGRKYTRKDRLTRHLTNKHGRVPKKKRPPK